MADPEQINRLIQKLSERTGASAEDLRGAVENANYSRLLSHLDPAQAQQVEAILGDEQKARQFLDSPQAKAILKRLMR